MESGAIAMLISIFAVPLRPVPRYWRSLRSFAGANPLKWLLVAVAAVGYLVAIVVYFAFALFPAVSYVMLVLLCLPLFVAVYAWKGLLLLFGSRRRSVGDERAERAAPAVPVHGHGLA
jgi:drug/metabolite transporter (DMT)-like permease